MKQYASDYERWLVTGACGQLGAHITSQLLQRSDHREVLGVGRRRCAGSHGDVSLVDLSDKSKVAQLLESYRPTHIVHLAGVSSPTIAEQNPQLAFRLNVSLTAQLARFSRETSAWLMFSSSDFVFRGDQASLRTEEDIPDGIGSYARTKVAGERVVRKVANGAVLRLSLMYGLPKCPRETTFTHLLAQLAADLPVRACFDEYRTPVHLSDAAAVCIAVGQARYGGMLHIAGRTLLTPLEMVTTYRDVVKGAGPIVPIPRASLSSVPRPRHSGLCAARLHSEFPDIHLRDFTYTSLKDEVGAAHASDPPRAIVGR